jgi:glycosyltransferase involved in cell wall biosynthesis
MKHKKKVVILGKLPPPYMGPAIATEIILNSRLKERFDLVHFDTKLNREISGIGKLHPQKFYELPVQYLKFFKVMIKEMPSLVLVPISQSSWGFFKDGIFILICKLFGRKLIIHLRGSNIKNWLAGAGWFINIYFRLCMKISNAVIVLGQKLRYLFADYFRDDKIFVVPNGGNYDIQPGEKQNPTEDNEKKVRLLYLGNLQYSKGIKDILGALVCLDNETISKVTLNVVGAFRAPEDKIEIIREIINFDLPVNLFPPAGKALKMELLSKADIFVFPPREPEGHPWVIIEAMAAGLPIISTDQGAITESVLDGVNGFIAAPNNPEQIAEKITMLVNDEEMRRRMGKESRRFYEENFTEDIMVERLAKVFYKVMGEV